MPATVPDEEPLPFVVKEEVDSQSLPGVGGITDFDVWLHVEFFSIEFENPITSEFLHCLAGLTVCNRLRAKNLSFETNCTEIRPLSIVTTNALNASQTSE